MVSIEDSNGVDDSTVVFSVNGVRYGIGELEIDWDEPTLTFDGGAGFFAHGSTVVCSLLSASDILGNELEAPLGWIFTVDYEPPELVSVTPISAVPVDDRSPIVRVVLDDLPAGIDYDAVSLDVEGYGVIDPTSTGLYWLGDTLVFDPDSLGILWTGGDSIELCLEIADLPDTAAPYCDANDTTYCWMLIISRGGPVGEIIEPGDGTVSACSLQQIIITLDDSNGIDEATIGLEVDGVLYTTSSTELDWSFPVLTWTPPSVWADGLVNVRLITADDMLGNPLTDAPIEWNYYMDLTPPTFANNFPLQTDLIRNVQTQAWIDVADNIAGVDPNELRMDIYRSTYDLSSPALTYSSGRLTFDPSIAGIEFVTGDTVMITVYAQDTPDYCSPNANQFTWWFLMEPKISCNNYPNPITPNGDGINDVAVFDYPEMYSGSAELLIFNKRNILVYQATIGPVIDLGDVANRVWNCREGGGQIAKEGLYLYLIQKSGETVCNGTLTIGR